MKQRRRLTRSTCLGLALVLAATATAFAQPAARSLSESAYARAREVLDAAVAAAGGREALRSLRTVSRKGSGTAHNQGQSLVPEAPYTTRALEVTSVVDLANRRGATETATTQQGAIPGRTRAVLAGDSGFTVNLVTNVVNAVSPGGLAGMRTAVRRDAAALLLTAESRAETLRHLGEGSFDGRPHQVVTFADTDGTQIALYVDAATRLVSKYETFADNPVLGDTLSEVVFSDYRAVDGVKLPFRMTSRTAGETTQDLVFREVEVNAAPAPALFEPPSPPLPSAAPAAGGVTVRKLADDVYLAEGGSHHSLFVAFADHVVLVEAPQGEERVQAVLARIAETVPGRPVKYVVPTHHHYDHSGGLRAAIAAGATVITTPGNKPFVETLARGTRTIRPDALARAPKPARVETFTTKKVLTDGTRTLELHDIGPNPHVKEAVIAYLPQHRIAFQADLIALPAQGPLPPASPATVDFVRKVRALGLQVDTIAGAHGRTGTMEEVAKAAAAVEAQATR
jgi:glyoxylase-like metal-dependent hydrolase (beta-lactamase superfamily II)